MAQAKRDENYVPTLIAVSSADGITPVTLYADPTTHRLLVSATAGTLDDLSDVVITSGAQGDILYHNGTNWVNLPAGTSGQFLKTQGAGANPIWSAATAGAAGSDTQIQFNDGGVNLGGDAGLVYNKTTDTLSVNGGVMPITSDTGALGSTTKMWADLFLASGAVINFNNGDVTLTHSAGIITLGGTATLALGTNSITMTGSIGATAARVTKGWFTDIESTNMPTVGGTAILTSLTAPQFTTIELGHATDTTISRVSAGRIAIEGVNVPTISSTDTLTNKTINLTSNTLTGTKAQFDTALSDDNFAYLATAQTFTALQTFSLAGVPVRFLNTSDSASVQVATLEGDRATMAANDEAYVSLMLSDSVGTQTEFGRITWKATTVTNLSEAGRLQFGVMTAGTLADELYLTGANFYPAANDGIALGLSGTAFSDLFLASGAVIDFNAGDVVITHSLNLLTISGGDLSIGTTGVFTAGTIELGNASDTTISRSAAGIIAVEGVAVPTISSTDTLSNKTLTAPKFADAGFIADNNGNEQIKFSTTASAVNEFTVKNAATGGAPDLQATGGDTNIDIKFTPKGTGKILPQASVNFGAKTAYFTETDNGNSGTADTIDWTLSNKQKSTLTGNCTFTFTAPPGPCSLILKLVQDATGSRTVTWPAAVHWSGGTAPTLTTTASRVDIISFYYDGTTYFGTSTLNFVA